MNCATKRFAGLSYNSSGEPTCSIAPSRSTTAGTPMSWQSRLSSRMSAGSTIAYSFLVTNSGNNFGPYQHPEKLIPLLITNLMDGLTNPIYGKGENVRDWIHVEDHCAGVLIARAAVISSAWICATSRCSCSGSA